ncbi:MAG TPA: hypothetical protein VK212_03365 [Lentimicrobium sp.]|nr:hypothetical protein [Lentimicrobium sp.]
MQLFTSKWIKRLLIIGFLLSTHPYIYSQSKVLLSDEKQIIEQAVRELNSAFTPPEGKLYQALSLLPVSNSTYIFDITVHKKGEIATVYAVNPGEGTIAVRNKLEIILRQFQLSFKMPKNNRYKFQYTIKY